MNPKLRLVKQRHRCEHCLFRRFFLSVGLNCDEIDQAGQTTTTNIGPYRPGEYLYHAGEQCNALYVVHAGTVKTEMVTFDGDLHVSGFYLTGELFGADGINKRNFVADAVAVENTWVCELTFDNWEKLAMDYPGLQGQLISELGRVIAHKELEALSSHYHLLEHRLMSFLSDLLNRIKERQGQQSNEIELAMTKTDIARYLGATPESISRALSKLEKSGYIKNTKRKIYILKDQSCLDAVI
ncbi:MAG: Crp/Fnr family transcriptional regulator [Candidatus Thiodiazotropha sp. (ex Lucinoma borealis)]|nr:Crp/Fnr family transcriptional regulator [Candidatus Thiodiazotropha sp. (ex Lucinoma borealis)]MCU7841097.1 Crp/Fnr family transcriptional regulator [Candidatus Thiodiazotropha sp. (ex Troendleina suluensis)]MCU7863493.1 Crp/Fnr family transcriptional regulator [Candidatus Thiodiazotropha sp. (ex Lucinoma borealis)]MCU7868952.1 Crp/Fnr family transcriptional regulator [Candidatus Thiodiazotropha sp. (ex Lucinoma borealis)]